MFGSGPAPLRLADLPGTSIAPEGDGRSHPPPVLSNEPKSDAEQVGDRFVRFDLNGLAQDAQGAVGGDSAELRPHLTGDQLKKRGLSYAVAANESCPLLRTETQLEIGKERTTVRRGL